jgi:hypothetical protein
MGLGSHRFRVRNLWHPRPTVFGETSDDEGWKGFHLPHTRHPVDDDS